MSQQNKSKSIIVRVPVRTYCETEIEYETFLEKWAPEREETETEKDYQRRCEKVWNELGWVKGRHSGVVVLDEIDEADLDEGYIANSDIDPLEVYGDAEDEWKEIITDANIRVSRRRHQHEERVRRENERIINVLKSMGAVEKKE